MWLVIPAWLAVFLSPTVYVLLLMIMGSLQVPGPVGGIVVALLFCLIPVVALLACGTMIWRSKITLGWRIGGLVVTVLAMLYQFQFLLFFMAIAGGALGV